MLSQELSAVFKLPVFISEQFRIKNIAQPALIKEKIAQKLTQEKLPNYFIFLGDTYKSAYYKELFEEMEFDYFLIVTNKNSELSVPVYDEQKIAVCSNCGNINCFCASEFEEKERCIICDSSFITTQENETYLNKKIENYLDCKNYLFLNKNEKCVNFEFTNIGDTKNKIVRDLVHK